MAGPVAVQWHLIFLQEENPTTKIAAIAMSNNFFFMVLVFYRFYKNSSILQIYVISLNWQEKNENHVFFLKAAKQIPIFAAVF